jgi:hypothetical protein
MDIPAYSPLRGSLAYSRMGDPMSDRSGTLQAQIRLPKVEPAPLRVQSDFAFGH